MAVCTAAKGSKSSCECIIFKYEAMNVEEGQSLSELLGLTVALKHRIKITRRAQQFAKQCNAAIT